MSNANSKPTTSEIKQSIKGMSFSDAINVMENQFGAKREDQGSMNRFIARFNIEGDGFHSIAFFRTISDGFMNLGFNFNH